MKYMLLIYMGEDAMTKTEREQCYVDSTQLCHDLAAKGKFIGANPLQPVATATTVRVRNGKVSTTDGPFAETKEQLGGFYYIEAKDLNDAIQIAARIPSARMGSIEVRPIVDFAKGESVHSRAQAAKA